MLENLNLYWQQPAWLFLFTVPWLLYYALRLSKPNTKLEKYIAKPLWTFLLQGKQVRNKAPAVFIIAWLFACIALAGPTLVKQALATEEKPLSNIVIVLDISPSMNVADVLPTRLEYSKRIINELIDTLDHHRIGLIAFSANAYAISPLTTDKQIIKQQLEVMDSSLVSISGSNLSRALKLASNALNQTIPAGAPGMVLLISDGEIHDQFALQASRLLKQYGHTLYTLGVGTEQGGPVPFSSGRLVSHQQQLVVSKLRQQNMQVLAEGGGGNYQTLSPDVFADILDASQAIQSIQEQTILISQGTPIFAWFLAPALLLFAWQSLRSPNLFILLLGVPLLLNTQTSEAADWRNPFKENAAREHFNQGQYQQALELYSAIHNYAGYIGLGNSAYQLQQWQLAIDAFTQAIAVAEGDPQKAIAAYNLGNALIQNGQLEEAKNAYQQTLVWQPGFAKANHNLALLKEQEPHHSGEQEGTSEDKRIGLGGVKTEEPIGNLNTATATHNQSNTSQKVGKGKQQPQDNIETLNQALASWGNQDQGDTPPASNPTWQQMNNFKEDQRETLKQRFIREDNQAINLANEKPW